MSVVDIPVKPESQKVEIEFAGLHNIELRKNRMVVRDCKHAILIVVLQIGEPEKSILDSRSAKAESGLATGEKRIWILWISSKPRVSRDIVISIIEKRRTMNNVSATSSNDVHRAASRRPSR